jgi:hypothetical protein
MDRVCDAVRRCDRCGELKAVAEFAWRRRRGVQRRDNYCRGCRAEYQREHYEKHKERYVERAVRRKQQLIAERAKFMIELFRARPCADCGETDPLVLEFDHLVDKKFNVGAGIRERNLQSVRDEIAKCDVVCANCHRRRTAFRAGSLRLVIAQRRAAQPTDVQADTPPR